MNALALLLLPALAWTQSSPTVRTVGQVVLEDVPPIPADLAERMRQYQNTRTIGLLDLDETGEGMLITTRFGETAQVHRVDAPLGMRRQLTFLNEPVRDAALRPGAGDFVYATDAGGSEDTQLFFYRKADGRVLRVTDGKSRNEAPLWSPSGDRLAYRSNERNGKDFDLWLYDPTSGERRLARELKGSWSPLDWSPDGKKLLLMEYLSITDSRLHLLDLSKDDLRRLLPEEGAPPSSNPAAAWAADGRSVYFVSDSTGEFRTLGRLDLSTGRSEWLSRAIPWDVSELEVAPSGDWVAFTVNEDGADVLYLFPPGSRPRRAEGLPLGLIDGLDFSRDGRKLGLVLRRPTGAGDAFIYETRSGKLTRWTASEIGGLPEEGFIEPSLVRFKSFDGLEVPAYYYKPAGPGPFPFVVSIHGGPEAQSRPWFDPTVQFWVRELGLAVLVPNVRGSSGYGKTYLELDNGRKREDSVKDIGALLDWAAARPELDASRAAVYGGSYGGYMVLASLAHYPERLRAGVDVVGISNFVTFLENTRDYRRDLRRVEYGDESDPQMRAFLEGISPTNLVDRIRSRLFVLHGANDPRVPVGEARQIAAKVRANGMPVWQLIAGDEGHGFAKKGNRDLVGQAIVLFWQEHLLPAR